MKSSPPNTKISSSAIPAEAPQLTHISFIATSDFIWHHSREHPESLDLSEGVVCDLIGGVVPKIQGVVEAFSDSRKCVVVVATVVEISQCVVFIPGGGGAFMFGHQWWNETNLMRDFCDSVL